MNSGPGASGLARRGLAAAAVCCALITAYGAPARAQDRLPNVIAIEFEGLFRIPEESVKAKLLTRVGSALEPSTLSEDIKRVFRMKVFSDVRVLRKDEDAGVRVRFVVKERPTIAAVRFEGYDNKDEDDLKKVMDLRTYEIADTGRIKQNVQKIKELYVEDGYYLVDVTYRLETLKDNFVNLILVIDEGNKVKVKSISFLGNRSIPEDELKGILQTQEGGWFSFLTGSGKFQKEKLDQDLQRLHLYYLTKGYINAKVGEPVVTLGPDRKSMDLTIPVTEGDKYTVSKIDVGGDLLFEKDFLLAKCLMVPGKTFDYMQMQSDSSAIGDEYKDLGYANATVSNTHVAHPEDKTIEFTYIIQKGEKANIGTIEVTGNETTRDKVIRRVLTIGEGDLFNATAIKKSRSMIIRLGFFEKVDIVPEPSDDPKRINLVIKVKERQTGTFQVGAGFSSLENFIATAQISKQNFLGHGQTLSFQATLSSIRSLYTISFFEPYFLDSNWTLSADLYNFQQDFEDFSRRSLGGSLAWGYRFTDEFSLSLGYKLEQVDVTIGGLRGRSSIPIANLFNSGLTSSLKATAVYDSRDDRMFPTSGQFTTLTTEFASRYLGSDNEFMRTTFRTRWYFPLFWDVVLKLNGTVGHIMSLSDRPVPIFERFFVGGIFDVRGFARNSLGPKLAVAGSREPGTTLSPFSIGGNKELIFNIELEFPILPQVNIKGVLFFDAGNAFNDDEYMNVAKLRASFGFGVRWFSPVGPLRFEWGIPVKPKPGEEPIVFEFTIGNSF